MGTTPNIQIPYPESTDLVQLGHEQIADIANATDSALTVYSNMIGRNIAENGDFSQYGLRLFDGSSRQRFDKFDEVPSGATTFTITQSTDHPLGSGFSLLATCTTATATPTTIYFRQKSLTPDLESFGIGSASAKPIAVRFWAKSSLIGTYNVLIQIGTLYTLRQYNIDVANTWQLVELTFPPYTTTPATTTFEVRFYLGSSAADATPPAVPDWGTSGSGRFGVGQVNWRATLNNTFRIAELTVEPTSNYAFEFLDATYDRLLLDRWGSRWAASAANEPFLFGYAISATQAYFPLILRRTLAAAPVANTFTVSATTDFNILHLTTSTVLSGISYIFNGTGEVIISANVAAGLTAGRPAILRSNNANAVISWAPQL